MAKNDYFSIVYKLLAILYDNLKDGVKPDLKAILKIYHPLKKRVVEKPQQTLLSLYQYDIKKLK